MRKMVLLVVASIMLGVPTSSALADEFVIQPDGGTVGLVRDFEGDFFRFAGDGFEITSTGGPGVFFANTVSSCLDTRCSPGDILNLGLRTPGEIFLGTGSAQFGSTTHHDLALFGALDFAVDPIEFIVPDEGPFFQRPFSFTGFIRGIAAEEEVFAAGFRGVGFVGLGFDELDGAFDKAENQQVFTFTGSETPAPVPEPTTVLLLGSGLAGLVGSRARRRA